MPTGLDYLPYRPPAPETQPQGGLLQGLEEGLDRLTKENQLRKQLRMKQEMDAQEAARTHQYRTQETEQAQAGQLRNALVMERERTANALAMEERREQARQQQMQMINEVLSSGNLDEEVPEINKKAMLGAAGAMLPGALGVGTQMVSNIIPNKTERMKEPKPIMQAMGESGDRVTFFREYPKTAAKLLSSVAGQEILKDLPMQTRQDYEKISLPQVSKDWEQYTDSVINQLDISPATRVKVVAARDSAQRAAMFKADAAEWETFKKTTADEIRANETTLERVKRSLSMNRMRLASLRHPMRYADEDDQEYALRVDEAYTAPKALLETEIANDEGEIEGLEQQNEAARRIILQGPGVMKAALPEEVDTPETLRAKAAKAKSQAERDNFLRAASQMEKSAAEGGPAVGTVEDGYRFKGGDPANQASWEKVR